MNEIHEGLLMSNISDLELNQLRLLKLIFETKNLTRAGERAGLTQSAVSHALKKMRHSFNDALVIRQGNTLVLTPRAESLDMQLTRWLNDFETNILNYEQFDPKTSTRTFYIGTSDLVEQVLAPKLMAILTASAPNINLVFRKLEKRSFASQIETNEVDFIVSVAESTHPSLMVKTLYKDDFVSAVRANHPLLTQAIEVKSFASFPHILAGTGRENRGMVDDALEQMGVSRNVQIKVANFSSTPYVLESSDCILTAPRKFLESIANKFEIQMFDPPVQLSSYSMKLYWNLKNKDDFGNRWMREQISAAV